MRYIAAASLHTKALQVLSLVEYAELKLASLDNKIALIGQTTSRNELSLWPMGMPRLEPIARQRAITHAAHTRLCAYYNNLLIRLKALDHSEKTN